MARSTMPGRERRGSGDGVAPTGCRAYAAGCCCRGGGLFSESISQWLGAVFALVAQRLGLRPTA
ncbi:hypothetical protein AB0B85_29530, partial [Micromonospora sp. NPDC049044]